MNSASAVKPAAMVLALAELYAAANSSADLRIAASATASASAVLAGAGLTFGAALASGFGGVGLGGALAAGRGACFCLSPGFVSVCACNEARASPMNPTTSANATCLNRRMIDTLF